MIKREAEKHFRTIRIKKKKRERKNKTKRNDVKKRQGREEEAR